MTPQERDLLTNLVSRLRQSPSQAPDQEALTAINDLVRDKPDTPYILAQTVLIQDYALHQAQARIADLEQQLQNPPHKEGGFLSSIFGSSKDPQPAPRPQPQPQQAYQPQPNSPQQASGPWGQGPAAAAAPQMFAQPSGAPSFLRSAATTAAGVAGGALLFQGIESLFHGGMGGGLGGGMGGFGGAGYGGFGGQPGLTETVVNNYYDSPGGGDQSSFLPQEASFDRDFDQGGQGGAQDASFDRDFDQGGQGGATDTGFDGGGDFGGGGGDDFV